MNLTCGRNPWKRASIQDSTFRAYLKNPKFLSSILPLSEDLDVILRRIFECDPRKRISISDLRELVVRCPRFTTRTGLAPPTPPPEVAYPQRPLCKAVQGYANPFGHRSGMLYTPPPSPPVDREATQNRIDTAVLDRLVPSTSGIPCLVSSPSFPSSSGPDHRTNSQPAKQAYVPQQLSNSLYGNPFTLNSTNTSLVAQPFNHPIQVC